MGMSLRPQGAGSNAKELAVLNEQLAKSPYMIGAPLVHRPSPTAAPAVDPATLDPACRPPVEDEGPRPLNEPGAPVDAWFSSRREARTQHLARVEAYAFNPYTQAREELYYFELDQQDPRYYFDQVRKDDERLGQLETTAKGDKRTNVMKIKWTNRGGGNIDMEMINWKNEVIVEGYVKQTNWASGGKHCGGKLRWVPVVTSLHAGDLVGTQTGQLFSAPLYEALATGVAFARWPEDKALQRSYPALASGRPRPADGLAALGINQDDLDWDDQDLAWKLKDKARLQAM